ncbi:MAG: hypothetical protein ACLQUY_09740 [Ktedonobacterales bacterium]
MTHYIVPWSPLTPTGSIILATVLFVITGMLLYIGTRIHHPLAAKRPGLFLGICLVVIFFLSGITFLVAATIYAVTLINQIGPVTGPANYITPITLACGFVAFFVILYLTVPHQTTPISPRKFWVAVGSAVVGTIAAPLIFELPFDLIVMGRVYSPGTTGTEHVLFTLIYFLPLFLVEISSFAMLTFSPFMKVSRLTLFLLAGMFFVFAVWAVFGFTYASTPLPYACNAISKILAFAVAVSLFLTRQPADRSPAEPIGESLPRRERVPSASGLV